MVRPKKWEPISAEEYFDMEERSEVRNEYFRGEIFAMTGASFQHNIIVSNVITCLNNALRDRECFIFPPDMKIEIDRGEHYVYPDVSVVCAPVLFSVERKDIVQNPTAIFEVLSDSAQDYDRGSKFRAYRRIPTLSDYVLIDQSSYSVEHFFLDESDRWILEEFESPDANFQVRSLDVTLTLDDIYHRIEWDKGISKK